MRYQYVEAKCQRPPLTSNFWKQTFIREDVFYKERNLRGKESYTARYVPESRMCRQLPDYVVASILGIRTCRYVINTSNRLSTVHRQGSRS